MIAPGSVIRWTDSLLVGLDFMDEDHREAVAAMNRMAVARGVTLQAEAHAFLRHCQDHFARENAMMAATGFFAIEPHQGEHERVLAELAGIVAHLDRGEPVGDYFTVALPQWFLEHRATMDHVTAEFARQRGWAKAG